MRPWQKKSSSKFGAKRVEVDGVSFPSKLEAAVYQYLLKREFLGEITDVKRQQTVVLQDGPAEVRIAWRVDFSFMRCGRLTYAEAKGLPTPEYVLKLKLFRKNPSADLEIYGGTYKQIKLMEKITK